MNIHSLSSKKAEGGTRRRQTYATVDVIKIKFPEIEPVITWLKTNKSNPDEIIKAAQHRLTAAGKHLPAERLTTYAAKVIIGEFFALWAKKHQGTTVKALSADEKTRDAELRPFEFALMVLGTAPAFKKALNRLARSKMVLRNGGELGNAADYSCFVVNEGSVLAHRFLERFDPDKRGAAAMSIKYLSLLSVSHYLLKGVKVQDHTAGLSQHMRTSSRMTDRTKLAAKLVYLPSLLTEKERSLLRTQYGLIGSLVLRMKVKDVAELFGYPSGNTLSRKFYRLREWIDHQQAKKRRLTAEEGVTL